jgi:hypothetical protein
MQYGIKFKICVAEKMLISLVASQVGMTERQLKYFMKENGLRARYFDEITDEELDVLTLKIVGCFPTIGTCSIMLTRHTQHS